MNTRSLAVLVILLEAALFTSSLVAGGAQPSSLYLAKCAKCHGEDGTADTPKGRKMKAQNFTDPGFQLKTDAQLIDAATNGTEKDMPPFGKVLTAEEIEGLVKKDVRGFAKK
jgi:mono/diheme cytochrome c family protein